jgi:hypothetical protein
MAILVNITRVKNEGIKGIKYYELQHIHIPGTLLLDFQVCILIFFVKSRFWSF